MSSRWRRSGLLLACVASAGCLLGPFPTRGSEGGVADARADDATGPSDAQVPDDAVVSDVVVLADVARLDGTGADAALYKHGEIEVLADTVTGTSASYSLSASFGAKYTYWGVPCDAPELHGGCAYYTCGSSSQFTGLVSAGQLSTSSIPRLSAAVSGTGFYMANSMDATWLPLSEVRALAQGSGSAPAFSIGTLVPNVVTVVRPPAPSGTSFPIQRAAPLLLNWQFSGNQVGFVEAQITVDGTSTTPTRVLSCVGGVTSAGLEIPAEALMTLPVGPAQLVIASHNRAIASPSGWDIRFSVHSMARAANSSGASMVTASWPVTLE